MTGKIAAVSIIEETDAVAGGLQSELKLELKDLVFEVGKQKKFFSPLAVRVAGAGSAVELAGDAVEEIFGKIVEALDSQIGADKQEKKFTTESKGFD